MNTDRHTRTAANDVTICGFVLCPSDKTTDTQTHSLLCLVGADVYLTSVVSFVIIQYASSCQMTVVSAANLRKAQYQSCEARCPNISRAVS